MKRSSFITWDQLKVGGIILAALAVLAVAIYKLGQAANLFSKRYELVAFLPNANGLRAGGTVFVAGQFAGTIRSIDFLPVDNDTTRNLRVRMAIDAALQEQIRGDSKAKVRTMGLLGDKVIDISIGTPRHGVLRSGDTISVAPSLDYEAVLAQVAGAVDDMVGADPRHAQDHRRHRRRTRHDRPADDESRAVRPVRRDDGTRQQHAGQFENPHGSLAMLLNDPTLYNRFVDVVTSADSLVVALNDKNGTVGKLLRDDTLYTHMVNMAVAGDSLMKMLSSGQGLAGRLLNDPTLYDKLNKLTTDLGAILDDIRKDPRQYLRGMICVLPCK